jgi:hypothetical protein
LSHFAGPPAGDIEEPVIHRKVDIADQRRHGAKALKQRRQLLFWGGLRWNDRGLFGMEFSTVAPPGPDRGFQVGRVDHDADEAVLANRIVGGSHLQRHLMVGAEVDGLHVSPLP